MVIVSAATACWPSTAIPDRPYLYLRVEECPPPDGPAGLVVDLALLSAETASERVLELIDAEVPRSAVSATDTDPVPYPRLDSAVSNIPPRNTLFTDRSEDLARVARVFLGPQQNDALRSCAVVGVGGVGKTQLAIEYAHRFASHYNVIWWIKAESPVSVLDDLTHLAQRLEIPPDADSNVVLGTLWRELGARHRWLLVFDNALDSATVAAHLPPLTNGDVLVTSYVRSWHGRVTQVEPLDVFREEYSVEFLRRRSHDLGTEPATAAAVASALGHLPLVLEQAAAYAEETGTTLAQFERVLHQQPASPPVLSQATWYQPVMTTTWRMSLQQACAEEPRSRELVLLLAFFTSDRLPRAILADHASVLPPPLRDHLTSELGVNALLRPLLSFSLVRAEADGTLGVSRQVQDFLRSTLQANEHRWYADAASLLLESAFPADPVSSLNWRTCATLLPHVLSVVQHGGANGTTEPLAWGRLLCRAGTYLHHRGDYLRARDLLEQSLGIWEAAAQDDQRPELVETLTALGRVQYHLAALDDARRTAERAVRLGKDLYGENDPRIVSQLLHLSRIQREQWQLGAAEETATAALDVCTAAYGVNHAARADCLMVLGDVHWRSGALGAAWDCYHRALTLREQVDGSRPGDLATSLKHLAIIALERDAPEEALEDLDRARALLISVNEEDHPDVADVDNHRGEALRRIARTHAAKEALEHALRVRSRLGDHPDVVGTLINLGRLDRDTDDLEQSAERLEKARRMAAAVMGPDHPYVADAERELAETLFAQGDRDRAVAIQSVAVNRYEAAYGHDHTLARQARSRLNAMRGSASNNNGPES
ncbi:FxSxx-COOH system tetratricopeptide repeat protein [Streptomyces sp. NPDC001714]|uniref:FxSxx-COOH system tetratricopeptide repeat protein n=1 Tax=Streptomyces sp. NPDC001714 TaxID=3364603 RepID=UPI003681FB49